MTPLVWSRGPDLHSAHAGSAARSRPCQDTGKQQPLRGIHGRAGGGRTAPVKHPGRYPGLSRQGRCPGFARYRPNRLVRWAGAPGQPLSEQERPREAGNAQIAGCSGLALLGAKAVGLARSRRSSGPARGTPQPTGSLQDHHRVTFAPRKCEVGPAPTALTCYRIMRNAADDCAI